MPRLYWSYGKIEFDNTPFSIAETKRMECQFGPHYYKEKSHKSTRLCLQSTRKMGCCAHIIVKKCILYTEYKIPEGQKGRMRTKREKQIQALKSQLNEEPETLLTKTMWFVSLPSTDAHTGHPTGKGVAGVSNRIDDRVAAKIVEIVADGITEKAQVRSLLRHYVMHHLCQEDNQPDPNDRAYFPLDDDLKNHIYMAKRAFQLSRLDQENVSLKIQQWQKTEPSSNHFFRPFLVEDISSKTPPTENEENGSSLGSNDTGYVGNDGIDDTCAIADETNCQQHLLWVHQADWQRDLLTRYGNTLSLLDATYKTTCYELPLFFLCVRTNVGYSVVGEFITQCETADDIKEALSIIKNWNPQWNPNFFMTDYSEAEFIAIQQLFPNVVAYLCDFHREQAWIRWTRNHKHGLSAIEAEELLCLLRACARAPSSDTDDQVHYKAAVTKLKSSSIWKNNEQVRNWLLNKWLSIPEVKIVTIVYARYLEFV